MTIELEIWRLTKQFSEFPSASGKLAAENISGFFWFSGPEMTLAQFPEFGFFVQNSRIGVISVGTGMF